MPVSSLLRMPQPYSSSRISRSRSAKAASSGIFASSTGVHLFHGRHAGQPLGQFRSRDQQRGIRLDHALPSHPLEERADGRERARHRSLAHSALVQLPQKGADQEVINRLEFLRAHEIHELRQIGAIGLDRVRAMHCAGRARAENRPAPRPPESCAASCVAFVRLQPERRHVACAHWGSSLEGATRARG